VNPLTRHQGVGLYMILPVPSLGLTYRHFRTCAADRTSTARPPSRSTVRRNETQNPSGAFAADDVSTPDGPLAPTAPAVPEIVASSATVRPQADASPPRVLRTSRRIA